MRASVRRALEEHGFDVCAEAANAADSVAAAERERPDVCVLDVHMPGDGIAAAAEIAARFPEIAVVMLTVSDSDDHLFAALRAGAQGYLLKDMDPDRLPLALEGVLAGEAALPRALVARVLDEFQARRRRRRLLPGGRGATLTDREWETLELLAAGLSTAETAERLLVAPVTVRRHTGSIVKKLDVPDRRSLLRLLSQPGGHPTEEEGRTYPSAG